VILMVILLMLGYVGFSFYALEYGVSTYSNTFTYLVNFSVGILGAYLYFNNKIVFSPLVSLLISIVGVFIFKDIFLFKIFISTTFMSIILLTIRYSSTIKDFFIFKTTEKLGEYTYGLYVYSGFVITFMLKQNWIENDFLIVLFMFLITLAIAVLSYHLYEKHFLKLKNYFRT
jgi:peptidoglycan/LPS O-acetylase OafA/YrhL